MHRGVCPRGNKRFLSTRPAPARSHAGSWSLLAGGAFGGKSPRPQWPQVVGAKWGPWVGSWAEFRWEGRGGEPGSSGTSGGLQGRPRKQHPPREREVGPEWPWLDIEGSPCVLGPAGPEPCPVRPAHRADGHHMGSVGGAEMEDRLCLPLRPHLHLHLPQRSTGPHPHGSRDAQMPT